MAEYVSHAQGNLNTVLGTIGTVGTAANVLPGLLGGWMNGGRAAYCNSGDMPVNRYEMDLALSNSAKDSEIAMLKSEKYTDEKLTAVYSNLEGQLNDLRERFDAKTHDNEQAINTLGTQVATLAATSKSAIDCIQQSIAGINAVVGQITKTVIPNTAICPGWGNVTITPATTATTTTPAA